MHRNITITQMTVTGKEESIEGESSALSAGYVNTMVAWCLAKPMNWCRAGGR